MISHGTSLRDKAAIVGIGETKYERESGRSLLDLLLEVSLTAIDDAGVSAGDIDGIIPPAIGSSMEELAANLNPRELRFSVSIHMGGASAVASLQTAAIAVASGVSDFVLSVTGWNPATRAKLNGPDAWVETRRLGMQDNLSDYEYPFGLVMPSQWYALMATRHINEYGITPEQMGAVAMAMRKHAILNENALMKRPLNLENYLNSKMITEPFRLLDCCLVNDGAAAVLVASAEKAKELKHDPVYIMGVAEGHVHPPDQLNGRSSLVETGVKYAATRAFSMAGCTPKDIDVAEIYDCFTWTALCQLEDIGFCRKGEGGSFVEGGRIELGGTLPVNTHGGLLSQAHVMGMNHVIEAVKQLRGVAGKAQVTDAETALVSGFGDMADGAVALLRR